MSWPFIWPFTFLNTFVVCVSTASVLFWSWFKLCYMIYIILYKRPGLFLGFKLSFLYFQTKLVNLHLHFQYHEFHTCPHFAFFYKDTNHIRLGPIQPHFNSIPLVKTLFLNKVTLSGAGGWDFNISLGGWGRERYNSTCNSGSSFSQGKSYRVPGNQFFCSLHTHWVTKHWTSPWLLVDPLGDEISCLQAAPWIAPRAQKLAGGF